MPDSKSVLVPVSPGELIDKITILQIKRERIADPAKRANVEHELALLEAVRDRQVCAAKDLHRLTKELRTVNESLWQIEDDIRRSEHDQQFGSGFIELARSVYFNNDRRAQLKRDINELLGSDLFEEKLYPDYLLPVLPAKSH
jgi:hypothetical protein